jgi:hypothetical protein
MATSTERNRRYRAARKDGRVAETQVNFVLSDAAVLALARLAKHGGATRRATVEALILAAQAGLLQGMTGVEQDAYADAVKA